jgi:hypothetical protein
VGAWESVVSHTSFYFGWEDLPDDAAVQWDRFRPAWPFLWHHMRCTAYFVATAVWNGDRHGLEHYLDCLLRWPDRLEHDLEQDYHISKGFVTSDLVEMEWTSVDARIGRLRPGYLDSSEPRGVFACILESAWRDVVWITAGIVLGWLNDRKSSDVLTRLALAQLRASEPASDQEFYRRRAHRTPEHEFNRLFQSVVRMELSCPRWSQEGYAADIHGLVNFLDLLSERDVIPRRGFTPTTRHDLHDLRLLFTALLLMTINEQEVKRINVTTPDFIDRVEAYFGDDGLSALNSYLANLCQYVREEVSRTYIEEIYGRVEDLAYFDSKCDLLLSVAQEHAKEVSRRRDDRIKTNVVNLETMAQI